MILPYIQIKETHVKEKRKQRDDSYLLTTKKNMCGYFVGTRVGDLERTVVTSRSLGENDTFEFPSFVIPKRGKKFIVFNVTKNGGRSIKATQGICSYVL